MRNLATLTILLTIFAGCRTRYVVVPASPQYLLKWPDGKKRTFPDTTSGFSSAFDGWVDLGADMALKLEKAYFMPPESRRLQDYLGLETAEYRHDSPGSLRQRDYSPLRDRPSTQLPVTSALPADQLRCQYHRFFFQVVASKDSGPARAVLLSGDSKSIIVTATDRLLRGDGCPDTGQARAYCTAIPELISASISFTVAANGKPLVVSWGSTVASIVDPKGPVKLSRVFRGRMVPIKLDRHDPKALRLPLLPGDALTFVPR